MTDDIVTRLRELLDGPVPMTVERQDLREAADEIERLRAELKQWQALCDTYYHKLALEPDNTFHFISGYRYLASGGK